MGYLNESNFLLTFNSGRIAREQGAIGHRLSIPTDILLVKLNGAGNLQNSWISGGWIDQVLLVGQDGYAINKQKVYIDVGVVFRITPMTDSLIIYTPPYYLDDFQLLIYAKEVQ